MIKNIILKIFSVTKKLSAFSLGMFIGVCYGSVVATLTTFFTLHALY